MVEFILSVDAETDIMKNEANFRNKKPGDLDIPAAFHKLLDNAWDAASHPDKSNRL